MTTGWFEIDNILSPKDRREVERLANIRAAGRASGMSDAGSDELLRQLGRAFPGQPIHEQAWLSDAEYENVLHNLAAWEKSEEAQLRAEYEMCQQSRMYQYCRAERLLTAVWALSGLVVALGVVLAGAISR